MLSFDRRDQLGNDLEQIAHDGHFGKAVLADLSWVDVCVDHRGIGSEAGELARHAIIESSAQGDEQVRLLQGADSSDGAMHARHAQLQGVIVREGTSGHQRGHDGDAGQLGQAQERSRGIRADHSAAHVEHGLT